ncbi:MAG TPA: UvrD-helicase domain-containing protein, partial [Fimbriimonadaceae bacterium]|nr:UvrD-helicase domain-containing protein [Fimbriimonadaceae bacterium]
YDAAQRAETGPIQTIHSLCERVLRENSLAAGVDPGFKVMGDADKANLIEEAVRWALATELGDKPEAEQLVSALAGKRAYDATQSVHAKLGRAIRDVLDKVRGSGRSVDELGAEYQSTDAVIGLWKRALFEDCPAETLEGIDELPPDKACKALVANFKKYDYKKPEWLRPNDPLYDEAAAADTCGLMQLALLAWGWAETQMSDRQEFDFALLENKAVELLHKDKATAERVSRQFKAILVDEAQDVNPVQYRLIGALGVEREMMVGDPQQSIYGFRLADRDLFVRRTVERPNLNLTRNHRSEPGILRFVDDLFTSLWPEDYQAMLAEAAPDDDPFGDTAPRDYTGVEAWQFDQRDTYGYADLIAQTIQGGTSARDIAVLVRSNRVAHDIAEALAAFKVPTRVIGGSEKFYTRLEVRDVANALEAVTDPSQDFQLLALLASPFVGLSLDSLVLLAKDRPVIEALQNFDPPEADKEKLERFLKWFGALSVTADRLPAWEVLAELFRVSPYLASVAAKPNAEQILANVRKLFAMAAAEPLLDPRHFAEKIRQVQELRHREGEAPSIDEDADAVTLMTIHRAKGLEFDVVVLPDTHGRIGRRKPEVLCDARNGLVVTRFAKSQPACYLWLFNRLDQIERAEELRVLYVGMTRACKRLCVVVPRSPDETTIGGIVTSRMHIGDGAQTGLVLRSIGSGP